MRSRFYGNGYINDTLDYQDLAANIVQGHGFARGVQKPTAFRSPVYPYFLAVIFLVFGISAYSTIWANILLSSLVILPLFFILKRLWGRKAAIIGCLIYCLMPQSIYWSIGAYSEPLLSLLLFSAWAFWIKAEINGKANIGYLIGFSILLGLLILLKIYLAGILLLLLIFAKVWKKAVYLTLILLIAVAPSIAWAARNNAEFGRFSVSSSGGYNFWKGMAVPLGYSPESFYNEDSDRQAKDFINDRSAPNREFFLQDSLYEDANRIINANLKRIPAQTLMKAILFFRIWPNNTSFIAGLIYFLPLLGIYLFGLVEIIITLRNKSVRKDKLHFSIAVFLTIFSVMCVYWDLGRFRFPCDECLIPLAAAGLLHIIDRQARLTGLSGR